MFGRNAASRWYEHQSLKEARKVYRLREFKDAIISGKLPKLEDFFSRDQSIAKELNRQLKERKIFLAGKKQLSDEQKAFNRHAVEEMDKELTALFKKFERVSKRLQ
ncbi:hypothetical protein HZB89_01755 [archaeon]|nr:hypothetical protein [archaeon]